MPNDFDDFSPRRNERSSFGKRAAYEPPHRAHERTRVDATVSKLKGATSIIPHVVMRVPVAHVPSQKNERAPVGKVLSRPFPSAEVTSTRPPAPVSQIVSHNSSPLPASTRSGDLSDAHRSSAQPLTDKKSSTCGSDPPSLGKKRVLAEIDLAEIAQIVRSGGRFLTEREVAALLAISPHTMRNWRVSGKGPKSTLIGSRARRWDPEDVREFIKNGSR